MSAVYFISDLHFGHKKILQFADGLREGVCPDTHDEALVRKWNNVVSKRDLTYVLGDVLFDHTKADILLELNGRKILVRGNHDERLRTYQWLKYFEEVYGVHKYKQHWLSHAPIHTDELRGRENIHGHVHAKSICKASGDIDRRYINVCVEALNGYPINYRDIQSGQYWLFNRIRG